MADAQTSEVDKKLHVSVDCEVYCADMWSRVEQLLMRPFFVKTGYMNMESG
jgi:hypothetical protein